MEEKELEQIQEGIEENTEMTEKLENADSQEKKSRSEIFLKVLIVTTVVIVGIVLTFYFSAVYGSKKIASKVAKAYATGTGEDLAELYAPGYIDFFEEQISYASFVTTQQQFIDSFRMELEPDVGEIQKINTSIESIASASNVADFEEIFAQFGVYGVTKYKQVHMRWNVIGSVGEREIRARVNVFKCDDGWFYDYILFMYE